MIVGLQWSVHFCSTATGPTHTYIHLLLLILSSFMFYPKNGYSFLCRTSLLVYSRCRSLHLLIPNSAGDGLGGRSVFTDACEMKRTWHFLFKVLAFVKMCFKFASGCFHCGSAGTSPTSIHEDSGSIPGLTRGLQDLALPRALVTVAVPIF